MSTLTSGDPGTDAEVGTTAPARVLDDEMLKLMQALAARYYRHGMLAQAAQLYAFLIRHEPTVAQHYLALGKAEHAQGWHEQALQSYSRAVRLGLADANVHLYIGQCLIFLGRLPLAEQALLACLRLSASAPMAGSSLPDRARRLLARVQSHHQPRANLQPSSASYDEIFASRTSV